MAMTTESNNGISAEINITPMIDILLVLLVIFMVIVPLEHGEMAEIPQPSNSAAPQPREDENIVIQVTLSGSGGEPEVKINKAEVPWDKLENKLTEIFMQRGNRTAFVKGDRMIDFQYVADVIDRAHHAGILRIGLLDPDHVL
jgi:biopolymer transport protein TolR